MAGLFGPFGSAGRTFRPKRSAPAGSKGEALKQHIDATLGQGNLRDAVVLPPGEDLNEWLAANTLDFFNAISVLYGCLAEDCTAQTCPRMRAGPSYEYRWADGVKIKKPVDCSAPEYVTYLMEWVEEQLDDERVFPQKPGAPFPPGFVDVVRTIFKRLFRVFAHIYHAHFSKMATFGAEAHLNTCFKHFVLFSRQFSLVEPREMVPLQQLIDNI